nr:hypothetical protein [Tanacetum cinerariifolium]
MMYEPDKEDQLWTHTQNFMHAPVDWKLYDPCGVHHVAAKDKEIFMLVEKDYPMRKGLAFVMICYKLQVENFSHMANELVLKIYRIANSPRQQDSFWRFIEDVITKTIAYYLFDVVVEFHRSLLDDYKKGKKINYLQLIMCGDMFKDSSSYLNSKGSIEDFVSFREMITSQLLHLRGSSYDTLFVLSSSNRGRLLGFLI